MKTKTKKRRAKKEFIESFDSYCDEYRYWKESTIVRRLVGIFEVPKAQFDLDREELLRRVGLADYSLVRYATEYETEVCRQEPISGAGCTVAVRNVYGRIQPVVFVRSDVEAVGLAPELAEAADPQFLDSIRLLVLMHELGHADDISKGINFDHKQLSIDLAGAEAYAHRFVCKHARRSNYPSPLTMYLENIDRLAKSEHDAERVGAELFMQNEDVAGLKAWIEERLFLAGLRRLVEQSGRVEEIASSD